MRVGMIGAQSKHVEYFGSLINRGLFGDARVEYIWGGDAPERLEECAASVGIENIADTPSGVINNCDAVIITLRDGSAHAAPAVEALEKRKPVFVDKPFTCTIRDALWIVDTAARTGTPFTGGSTLCFLPEVPELTRKAANCPAVEISYRADLLSPYGGWYFYGSHLTDLCAAVCGTDALKVKAWTGEAEAATSGSGSAQPGAEVFVDVHYPRKTVRLYSAPDLQKPKVVLGTEEYILDDEACYKYGMEAFFDTISSGGSRNNNLLFSVRLMDAIMRSLSVGGVVSI